MKHLTKYVLNFLPFTLCFLICQNLYSQVSNKIEVKPSVTKHEVNAHVFGANRNHSQRGIMEAQSNTYAPYNNFNQSRWEEVKNAYSSIQPPNGRKIIRLGHTPTDGQVGQCGADLCNNPPNEGKVFNPNNPNYADFAPITNDVQLQNIEPCGYHFAQYIAELQGQAHAGDFKYPQYDDLSYIFGEAKDMDADVIIVVNFGSGTPDEAAAMVNYIANKTYADGEPWMDRMAFFEIGNEITGFWEVGNECTPNPFSYASKAKLFIDKMKSIDPTIEIGVCASHGWDFGWSSGSKGNDMIDAYAGSNSPLLDVNGEPLYNYICFHGYNAYPNQMLNLPVGDVANPASLYDGQYDELNQRLLGGAIRGATETVSNLRLQLDNLLPNNQIKFANSEFSAYMQDYYTEQHPIFQSTTEAMYLAENIRLALEFDYGAAVNFSFIHLGAGSIPQNIIESSDPDDPDYVSDNLFFNYNYDSSNNEVLEKPNFCVMRMIANEMGETVVESQLTAMDRIDSYNLFNDQSTSFDYDKVGVLSTVEADGTIKVLLINRTGENVNVDLSVDGAGSWQGEMLSQGGMSWKAKEVNFGSYNSNNGIHDYWYDNDYVAIPNLEALELKARSINIVSLSSGNEPCQTYTTCSDFIFQICNNVLSITNVSGNVQSANLLDIDNGYAVVANLFNTWNGSVSNSIPAQGNYQINVSDVAGNVLCAFIVDPLCNDCTCDPNNDCPCETNDDCPVFTFEICDNVLSVLNVGTDVQSANLLDVDNGYEVTANLYNNWNGPVPDNVSIQGNYQINVSGGGNLLCEIPISTNNKLSFNTNQNEYDLSIAPNPASSVFKILKLEEIQQPTLIRIYDQLGKLLQQIENGSHSNNTIDISDLSAGVYLVKVSDQAGKIIYQNKLSHF